MLLYHFQDPAPGRSRCASHFPPNVEPDTMASRILVTVRGFLRGRDREKAILVPPIGTVNLIWLGYHPANHRLGSESSPRMPITICESVYPAHFWYQTFPCQRYTRPLQPRHGSLRSHMGDTGCVR